MDSASMNLADWRRMVQRWVEHHYLTPTSSGASYVEIAQRLIISEAPNGETQDAIKQLFTVLNRARILTLIREGMWGCVGINGMIAAHVQSRLGWRASGELFAGAPLLICRNDHARGLFNGDVGLVLKTAQGSYRAVFARQDGYLTIPAESVPAHELAFALTVHKSQGSEYGQVLLVLPPEGGRRLLTREMIYTGITRARELALLCGPTEVLRQAIGRGVSREDGPWDLDADEA